MRPCAVLSFVSANRRSYEPTTSKDATPATAVANREAVRLWRSR
jgi:hypothetical protein